MLDIIPERIPHRFKSILTAMAQQTRAIPNSKRHLKKHSRFKPREFPWILSNAFLGKEIPVFQLRNALRYRQVSFYKEETLVCRDDRLYLDAIQGYAALFQNMGYKGWIVFFDEAESIMLTRINHRSKSYSILHDILCPDTPVRGFFPVFAFTHDFFTHLKDENFERTRIIRKRKKRRSATPLTEQTADNAPTIDEVREKNDKVRKKTAEAAEKITETRKKLAEAPEKIGETRKKIAEAPENSYEATGEKDVHEEKEVPYFERNYSKAWQEDIHIYHLRDLTSREWHVLIKKLIRIHALAYQWKPDVGAMDKMIFSRMLKQSDAESRMKLKLIVNLLDLEQQQLVISAYS